MSVQALSGMYNYGYNPYNNYAAYADLNSLYNYQLPSSNYYGMGMGMGMPAFTGGNYQQQFYDNMKSNLNFQAGYQVDMLNYQRNYEFTANAPNERISSAVAILNEKIVSSEQEQIIGAYNNLKEAIRSMYPNASEADIKARANTCYTQLCGTSIVDDIRKNGSSSFTQGMKQVLGLGIFADRKTAEENIAEITGQPVSRSQNAQKIAGGAIGGALPCMAIGAAICSVVPGIGTVVGALVGAGVGAVAGTISKLF